MSFEELDENLFRIEVPLPKNPLRALNVYLLRAARLNELHDILTREGPCGAYAVAAHMRWSIREKCWEDFPPAQKWFACGEALAHLEHLCVRGKIRRIRRAGQTLYTLS